MPGSRTIPTAVIAAAVVALMPAAPITSMRFWSLEIEELALTAAAQDLAIADVVVTLPADVTIHRVVAGLKARALENTNAAQNEVEATAQTLQVRNSVAGTWTSAFTLTQGGQKVEGETREMGPAWLGNPDLSTEVTGSGTYNTRLHDAEAILGNLNLNDVQAYIDVYYSRN